MCAYKYVPVVTVYICVCSYTCMDSVCKFFIAGTSLEYCTEYKAVIIDSISDDRPYHIVVLLMAFISDELVRLTNSNKMICYSFIHTI